MNLKEINEKLDRLDRAMYLNQKPMQYAEHYGGYQPDYQEASIEHNDWISEEVHYMGRQGNFQFQSYNNNLSDWNQNVEYPHGQVYTPFQNQQGQRNYQGNNYGNQGCYQGQMSNQNRGYINFNNQDQPSQDDEVKLMLKKLLEGQESNKKEFSEMRACHKDLNSKFEGLATHVKGLENQIAQVASTSRILPNPNEYCQDIILRSGTELHRRAEAEKMDESKAKTERPEEEKESLDKEADSKIHDGETSFLELKEELNVMEIKEASNGKTSMESEGEAEKQDDWSKLRTPNTEIKPLPQELRALKRYEGTNIVLNWKKCHFMEREGTILGSRTSEEDIEVDKAIVGPVTHLLCEETSFVFNKVCLEAFTKITRELVNESIVHVPDWSFPFESGGNFTATLSEPLTA